MIVTRIRLHNYRQHADIDRKIEGSVIAVVGRNGSGKSNLLGAIQFAFTGEQSGFNKKDLLRWGADAGDVTVEFNHDNVKCVLARSLHTPGATLVYGDKTYKGATSVAEALKTHLGLDKDLCKQAVFVRQAEIDAILFTDPAVRERSFQRLMGIGDAAKIHKVLGEAIAEIEVPANYDEQIAEGKARWAEMHVRLQALQGQLQGMDSVRAQAPSVAALKQEIAACNAALQAVRRYRAAALAITGQRQRVDAAELALKAVDPVDGQGGGPTLDQLDDQIRMRREDQQALITYLSTEAEWKRAGEAVLQLGSEPCAPARLQQLKAEYDDASARLSELQGRYKLHGDMLRGLQGTGSLRECPVCGAPVADATVLQQRLTSILQGLDTEGRTLNAALGKAMTAYRDTNDSVVSWQREYAVRTRAYDQATQKFQSLKRVEGDVTAIDAELMALARERKAVLDSVMARTAAKSRLDAEKAALDRAGQELANAVSALALLGLTETAEETWLESEIRVREQSRDAAAKLDTEIAGLRATVTELSHQMTALDKTVATLELKRGTQQELRDAVAVLTRTRDWFHYANGPHTLSKSVLGVMNQEVNRFLGQFTAPFTVEPSNDMLGFRCLFTDGRPVPPDGPPDASMLSGGQKIQLAVAFRFAAYTIFASKLGLLSLDEPTVYLDDANVGRFCDLLQRVKQVAQSLNLQVWIATHERSVMSFVDTVIDLTPDTVKQ